MKSLLKQLFVALMLLLAGAISPSNGVDDRVNRQPVEMLIETFVIIAIGVLAYLIHQHLSTHRRYHVSGKPLTENV